MKKLVTILSLLLASSTILASHTVFAQSRFTEGETVIIKPADYSHGVVRQVLSGGLISVEAITGPYKGRTMPYAEITLDKIVPCLEQHGICANDTITDPYGNHGSVVEVFPSHERVRVKMTDGPHKGITWDYAAITVSLFEKCSQTSNSNCHQ